MPNALEHPLSASDLVATAHFAEDLIAFTLRSTPIPPSRLLAIVRLHFATLDDPATAWDLAALEGDAAKPLIEARSGLPASTEEAAKLLGYTTQTIRNRVEADQLIAYPALRGRGLQFPRWQFHRGTVRPWVAPLLAAYGGEPGGGWGLLDFVTVPRLTEGGESAPYLDLLKVGHVEPVLAAARLANPR